MTLTNKTPDAEAMPDPTVRHPEFTSVPATSEQGRVPLDAATGRPIPPREQPGYYPGFSTLSQQGFWDEATRNVVLKRVNAPPPMRFFTQEEARLLEAVADRIIPQDDRDAAHKVPIVPVIDDRLYHTRIDGYRYEDMPPTAKPTG